MSPMITGTRNQALLTLVIQEAHTVAEAEKFYFGRTALQKIIYFLKILGVPMQYTFEIHYYGPFCDEILDDIELLIADEVICDLSQNRSKYSNYAPCPQAEQFLTKHGKSLKPYRKRVRDLVRALVPLSPERLELFATLDYLYRWHKASGGRGPWKGPIISHFQMIKPEKFDKEDVEKAYNILVDTGLIESDTD